jgi:hypothetical protein
MILHIEGIVIGDVGHTIVSKAIAAKLLGIRIEHYLVAACRNQESIVGITACG